MTSKIEGKLLPRKKAANRGRKIIRKVTKKIVPRTEVYKVWDAYMKECFYEELLSGKEVAGMANVGRFVIEKKPTPKNMIALRNKGFSINRNGFIKKITKINLNNTKYVFSVSFMPGKYLTEGIKFYPCTELRNKMFEIISAGKDFRLCQSKN